MDINFLKNGIKISRFYSQTLVILNISKSSYIPERKFTQTFNHGVKYK